MITKEKYLEALKIVEAYHSKLKFRSEWILLNDCGPNEEQRMLVDDWLYENREKNIPARVRKALEHVDTYGLNEGERTFTYMDEVEINKFLSIRNVGVTAWRDFEMLNPIDKY
jgi:hypothetical protein